jgi:hypothetical protein
MILDLVNSLRGILKLAPSGLAIFSLLNGFIKYGHVASGRALRAAT